MSFLKTLAFAASDASSHPDALTRLRADEIQAVVIHDVFTAGECARIVGDLASNIHDFPTSSFPTPFRSSFYGMNLNLADPDLRTYRDASPRFARSLEALLRPHGGFDGRVLKLLSTIDGRRRVRAPAAPNGSGSYMITTIREHREGGYIPPHFDNEQRARPSLRGLEPQIEGDLFSFVLTLAAAESGGFLEVFDAEAESWGDRFVNRDRDAPKPDLAGFARQGFPVEAGTMVLLRSGRYLHHVTPVAGGRSRWTACSFMARSKGRDEILCWG